MGVIINNPTAAATATGGIRENYFKNPAFSIIQGTASGTVPNSLALPTASLGYPGEAEWCIAASGGTPTYAFNTANQTLTLTGASGTTELFLLQRIESRDANRLASKQVTLSIELSNSLMPTVSWQLYRPTTAADTHGIIASPTQTLIASGTWTVTSTLTRYSTTVTLPAEVSNGLEVRIRVGSQTSGTWVIARPKLEEGFAATNFVCEDVAVELAKCQRYYRVVSTDFYMYTNNAGQALYQPVHHIGMFGSTRVRSFSSVNAYSGTNVSTIEAGTDGNSSRIIFNGSAAGYIGARPVINVAAHIP
jgi:hypothetical protein